MNISDRIKQYNADVVRRVMSTFPSNADIAKAARRQYIEDHGDPGDPNREAEIEAREYRSNHPSLTAEERNR